MKVETRIHGQRAGIPFMDNGSLLMEGVKDAQEEAEISCPQLCMATRSFVLVLYFH